MSRGGGAGAPALRPRLLRAAGRRLARRARPRPRGAGPRGGVRGHRRRERPRQPGVGRARRLRRAAERLRARGAPPGAGPGGDRDRPHHRRPRPRTPSEPTAEGYRGRLVAVTGSSGTGRSTVAAAIAQGLAGDPRNLDLVCLADLALHAEQAMLHGAADVVPGVVELVEAHRAGAPVDRRGPTAHLARHRPRLPPPARACAATATGRPSARARSRPVSTGSAARSGSWWPTSTPTSRASGPPGRSTSRSGTRWPARPSLAADLVVVVGLPGMKGLHSLLGTTRDLLAHGVPATAAPARRQPGAQGAAGPGRADGGLRGAARPPDGDEPGVPGPLFLGERRHLDDVLRDGARLPDAWLAPLAGTVQSLLDLVHDTVAPRPCGRLARARRTRLARRVDRGAVLIRRWG